ncbi:prolipoprotein diacylglyceryl transferase [Sandaracinobacteroides saxicola]|uniref:Phosphatidylglycerol--prolipoprotein diacylglyceryl transferase n=1 Tax=Sandaracinobacteroides saxicola TaxID=2759707 RepID=A0A7G5IGM5_9SPHN|nr:prolipoprotein diacylglyceryl transferase [Sandaracinobacteroides saxicola]QMW22517.1 prolipoprotein diacylglyceryl transferase [Sandaracinobacteroides saxicola]
MILDFFQHPVEWASLNISPIALSVGPLDLRWYSLAYIAGIVFAWWALARMIRRRSAPPMTSQNLDELISWATLGVIAGGRLGYVLFYNPRQYLADPLEILKLWDGGMSFHGGALGVMLAIFLYCRKHGLDAWRVLDYAAVVQPMGQLLGRLANFINGELPGKPTDGSWGIIFEPGGLPAHPSTLYAAASEGLFLLLLMSALFWFTRARLRPGLLAGIWVGSYGLLRLWLETFRAPDPQLTDFAERTGLHMGQWLCLPMIAAGLWLIWRARRRAALVA